MTTAQVTTGEFEALREEVRRYRTLFAAIDKGFCIVDMEFDGQRPVDFRFLDVNPAFEEQTGLRDVVGRSARELLPDLEDEWLEVLGEVARTGRSTRFVGNIKALGGRWYEVYAYRPGVPSKNHVAVLFRDVSEQRRVDQELATLHSRLESALEAAVVGTWEFDVLLDIVWGDRHIAHLFGIPRAKAAAGHSIDAYFLAVHPDDRQRVRQALYGTLEDGDRYAVEMRALGADGTERHVLARGRVLRDEAGRAVRCPGVVIDLTERRELEKRIEAQSRELLLAARRKDQFLAMLSHELRSPMAPIFSALHLLQNEVGGSPGSQRALSAIDRQMRHLTHLVDDLLEVSRITSGRVHLRTDTVDLRDIVTGAVERIQPVLDRNRQTLRLDLGDETLWVCGDPSRLEQVVGNVLHNAAKYSEEDRRIDLTLTHDGEAAVVRVRDQGLGIEPDLLPHIFDLFTQADESLDRAAGGLGIGLALVRRLVELHGGTVEAHSEGVGRGSEFVLRFPTTTAPCDPESSPVSDHAVIPVLRVLVVEDNTDSAEMLASVLDLWGHETQVAHDGPSALAAARESAPDVVLLDIGLPDLDGFTVARRLRESPEGASLRVVAVTGYGSSSDRELSREAGFDAHLVKPVMMEDLEKVLTDLFVH